MAENTKIEWATHTFNPWRGCTKVSAGCANCYAEKLSGRNPKTLGIWGPNGTRVVAAESAWKEPLKWDRQAKAAGERHRVFCASLADVFEDWDGPMVDSEGRVLQESPTDCDDPLYTNDVRRRLFDLICRTPNLDWLVLTKRPENIMRMAPPAWTSDGNPNPFPTSLVGSFPHNVWIGTSVENQAAADERIPHLLRVPAAVRFLSCEPLLGPVDFRKVPGFNSAGSVGLQLLRNLWVIVGGESGPGARPCRVGWVRDIVRQCKGAGVPCFVKQMGAVPTGDYYEDREHFECNGYDWPDPIDHVIPRDGQPPIGSRVVLPLVDRKGGDWSEWPEDLRVREFPEVKGGTS